MSELRPDLDEDAEAQALVRALRDRSVDVTPTSEAGLIEISDEELLLGLVADAVKAPRQADGLGIGEGGIHAGERVGAEWEPHRLR